MNDRELLELAAKAAGLKSPRYVQETSWGTGISHGDGDQVYIIWNPLKDDGDAIRLAVKLNLLVDCFGLCVRPLPDSLGWFDGSPEKDSNAAMRRAIVRAAAEIGRAMP